MTYQSHVLSQLPMLYLPFTETSGTTFADLSGYGHTLTPDAGIVTPGGIDGKTRGERASLWNGSCTAIDNVSTLPTRLNFTWSVWFRSNATFFTMYRIGLWHHSSPGGTQFLIFLANNNEIMPYDWQFGVEGPGDGSLYSLDNPGQFLTCWHHFVVTWNGSIQAVYMDGLPTTPAYFSAPNPSTWNTTYSPDTFHIDQFSGLMGINHLAMYAHCLSAADVAADYAAAAPYNTCTPAGVRLKIHPGLRPAVRLLIPAGMKERLTIND